MSTRVRNQVRFMRELGGPISTKGRGAVALRFDHGLAAFRSQVLPVTAKYGFKVAQAYNPRNWHYDENRSVTPAELNSWVEAGHVEIMNHSASHAQADTRAAVYEQVVGGRREIEAQLPAAKGRVWGFATPGTGTTSWMGFNEGRTPASWASYPGRLILDNHAVTYGYMQGTHLRVLDGSPRIGMAHLTVDALTVQEVITRIEKAMAQKKGLELMLHPAQLDAPGKLATTSFLTILNHLATQQDSGELVVLSPYELAVADSRGT